jgi:hypothetical protein
MKTPSRGVAGRPTLETRSGSGCAEGSRAHEVSSGSQLPAAVIGPGGGRCNKKISTYLNALNHHARSTQKI